MSTQNTSEELDMVRKYVPLGVFFVLIFFSLDHALFHLLPPWIGQIPRVILFFFIIFQAYRSYSITRITEFSVVISSIFMIFVRLPSPHNADSTITLPTETFDDALFKIIGNILLISLIIPWHWFAYQVLSSKLLRWLLLISTVIVYPVVVIAQFISQFASAAYLFSILFMLFWLTLASLQIKIFYPSHRNKQGKRLIILAILCLALPIYLLCLFPHQITLGLAHLGVDAWMYLMWFIILSHSHAFILTKNQTLSAVDAFYELKSRETIDCIVYENVDEYLRNIPEDLIYEIDSDRLTLIWIGLQRTS